MKLAAITEGHDLMSLHDGMIGSKVVTVDRQTLLDASASLALLCPFIYNLISMIIIIDHANCGGC